MRIPNTSEVVEVSVSEALLEAAGASVEVVALPVIFDQLRGANRSPGDAVAEELLRMVKIYNYVAPEAEVAWREVLAREYAAHCQREVSR